MISKDRLMIGIITASIIISGILYIYPAPESDNEFVWPDEDPMVKKAHYEEVMTVFYDGYDEPDGHPFVNYYSNGAICCDFADNIEDMGHLYVAAIDSTTDQNISVHGFYIDDCYVYGFERATNIYKNHSYMELLIRYGTYNITIVAPGYEDYTTTVKINQTLDGPKIVTRMDRVHPENKSLLWGWI